MKKFKIYKMKLKKKNESRDITSLYIASKEDILCDMIMNLAAISNGRLFLGPFRDLKI